MKNPIVTSNTSNNLIKQKRLGQFYTPPQYAKLACGLVRAAVRRALNAGKKDYVIIDTCAGTGNLEMHLNDEGNDLLSHVIVSTYDPQEQSILKNRFGIRVRYIVPPPSENTGRRQNDNEDQLPVGTNALERDIIDDPEVRKYLNDDTCAVIVYINPPFVETTGVEFQKNGTSRASSLWKDAFMARKMREEVKGPATHDMANVFIWSTFKYLLRQPTDSLIVFSPVKYWKVQNLVNKRFMGGYAFNRKAFQTINEACISCIYWSNEDAPKTEEVRLKAINLVDDNIREEGEISVRRVHTAYKEAYYDTRTFPDELNGIACEPDGTESKRPDKSLRIKKRYNKNIVGYLVVPGHTFDNARLISRLTIAGVFSANGFYLRSDNFVEKLPMFAASRYTDCCDDWKSMSMIMKSADGSARYVSDLISGQLNPFLFRTLLWTCTSHYPHMRSLYGSDNRLYLNQLCLDGDTLAKKKLDEFISKGYSLTEQDQVLLEKMNQLLKKVKAECPDEYRPEYTYGLYQIDKEINVKVPARRKTKGELRTARKYPMLDRLIKEIKALTKQYYRDNLVNTLFEYEFLK